MRIAARAWQKNGDRGAKRGNLGEREIDEDDSSLDDVNAEEGVYPGDDPAGYERRGQKRQYGGIHDLLGSGLLDCVDDQVDFVVEQFEIVRDFFFPTHRRR